MRSANSTVKLRWSTLRGDARPRTPSSRPGPVEERKLPLCDRAPRDDDNDDDEDDDPGHGDGAATGDTGRSDKPNGGPADPDAHNADAIEHDDWSSSDADSILSKPEGDAAWDDIQFDETGDDGNSSARALERLEAKFARRDRILDRIGRGKSRSFVELLRRHEREVRSNERERLALQLLYRTRGAATSPRRAEPQPTHEGKTGTEEKRGRRNLSFVDWVKEELTYELCTTVPATFSFSAQALVDFASYEITSILVWLVRRHALSDADRYQDGLMGLVFLAGVALMRVSGSLYWWLNDGDYGLTKFAMHNRLRLGRWDAQLLRWVRGRSWLRCFLFIFGYFLCYDGLLHFFYRFLLFCDESESLLRRLPSSRYDRDVCMPDLDRFVCDAELAMRERSDDYLERADSEHVYWLWSDRSHDFYWVEGEDGPGHYGYPLLSWNREILLLFVTVIISLSALTWYGFIYWNKY